jgi:hypothetical protein
MKVRLLVAACAVVGAAFAGAAPASAASKCSGKGAQGILSSGNARVFSLPSGGERKIYACLFSQNKRRFLGWEDECQNMTAASQFILSGPYVGYVETTCGLVSGDQVVVVRDIKANKVKYRGGAVRIVDGGSDEEPSTYVTDLAMSRTGSVAWIGEYDAASDGVGSGTGDRRQVRMLFEGSAVAGGDVVEDNLAIAPGSLALGPQNKDGFSWLYFQVGDQPRTAKLQR